MIIGGTRHGTEVMRWKIKVFGGGKIYDGMSDVGTKNATWALDYLKREGLQPIKADVGDVCPRKVYYFTESGRVLLKKLDRVQGKAVAKEEERYQQELAQEKTAGEVTLF